MGKRSTETNQMAGFTRREFFKFIGLAALGAGTVVIGGGFLDSTTPGNTPVTPAKPVESESQRSLEELQLLNEIIGYRNAIGLDGMPKELQAALDQGDVEGPLALIEFHNALPEKNISYGIRTAEYMKLVFGSYSTQMVKGAMAIPDNPNGIGFTGGDTRYFVIADNIHAIPIVKDFDKFILHEACGHGSDPVSTRYTNPVLIRVEHGKWRALSQAFAVPEQFFNHPEDSMFPLIKRSVGAIIGHSLVYGNQVRLDEPLMAYAHQITQALADSRGLTPGDLKYNKALCEEIGYHFIGNMHLGRLKFTGGLDKAYQEQLESACVEIYAEMFKYAILYPDQIHQNHEILTGIKEVIEGVRKESVDLTALRKVLATPSNSVLERHKAEAIFIEQQISAALSPEEQASALKQQQETERREKAFSDFAFSGAIPMTLQITDVDKGRVEEFAELYSKVISKFPSLQHTAEGFDPNLHLWEIQEIEEAMDSGFVRDLTASYELTDVHKTGINEKIAVLEKFVASPAFQI